ncbi:MAG TPA: HNH endonuclease signature motif containing protein [Chloroflexota bacterium]|nr:HNH endonuclease signature motif containing protein [Chloroflexota bacterium]
MQPTPDALRAARARGEGLAVEALQVEMKEGGATLGRQLAALEALGLAERTGAAVKGDPLVWWATAQPSEAAPAPPTSDPAYVRYLNTKAWATRRGAVVAGADGACEDCGAAVADGEMEVHHLTYERVGRELSEDLTGLCPGCHRHAHA